VKTIEQTIDYLTDRISQQQAEVDYCQEWILKARENHERDRRMWGSEADNGELILANNEYGANLRRLETLRGILFFIKEQAVQS